MMLGWLLVINQLPRKQAKGVRTPQVARRSDDWRKKMRYAIVESGGKQYKAVEGQVIEVDRLSAEQGSQIDIARVLLMADGDTFMVGTPTVKEILVKATIVEHFRGPKIFRFKYSPKKRIRVRGGHRQQYTRLMVDFIGRAGEERKVEAKAAPKVAKTAKAAKDADDLAIIEGIGPKVVKVLKAAGISTFAKLSETSVEDLKKTLADADLQMMDPTSWPEQAKLAAEGDTKGLQKLQDKLKGGRAVATKSTAKGKAAEKKSGKK
jgi:large subunit ribosomal protein L21